MRRRAAKARAALIPELTDAERLRLICQAFVDCEQPLTAAQVDAQFRTETGRWPKTPDRDRALRAAQRAPAAGAKE